MLKTALNKLFLFKKFPNTIKNQTLSFINYPRLIRAPVFSFAQWKNFNPEIKQRITKVIKQKGVLSDEYNQQIQKIKKQCFTTDIDKSLQVYQSLCAALYSIEGARQEYLKNLTQYSNLCYTAQKQHKFFSAQQFLFEILDDNDNSIQAFKINDNLFRYYSGIYKLQEANKVLGSLERRTKANYGQWVQQSLYLLTQKSRLKIREKKSSEAIEILKFIDQNADKFKKQMKNVHHTENQIRYAQLQLAQMSAFKKDKQKAHHYLARGTSGIDENQRNWHQISLKLSYIYFILGDHQKALQILNRSLQTLPKQKMSMKNLLLSKKLEIVSSTQNWVQVKKVTKQMLANIQKLDPRSLVIVYDYYLHACQVTGDLKQGLQDLSEARQKLGPQKEFFYKVELQPLYLKSCIQFQQRKFKEASQGFLKCHKLFQQNKQIVEQEDPKFQMLLNVNSFFAFFSLRQPDKTFEYGSKVINILKEKKISKNQQFSFLSFYRTFTGFLRITMKDPRLYADTFLQFQRILTNLPNLKQTDHYLGYLTERAIFESLSSNFQKSEQTYNEAKQFAEEIIKSSPKGNNAQIIKENIQAIRKILDQIKSQSS